MQTVKVPISSLNPAVYNPRIKLDKTSEEYKSLKRSIEEFGYIDPIIANSDGTIIGGHQRFYVLQDLGYTEIDIIQLDLDEQREKALNVALNKISGEWDSDKLSELLKDLTLGNFDVTLTGFQESEINELLDGLTLSGEGEDGDDGPVIQDAFDEALPEEPETQYGDIYILGNHRLMCGDSTVESDIVKLMNGKKADLIVTDPPYNVNISNSQGMTIDNDNMEDDEFLQFLNDSFYNLEYILKPGGVFYIWHADLGRKYFEKALNNNNLYVKEVIIWNKNSLVLGHQDYHWKHEPCLYGWKSGAAHYFIDDRTQTTVFEDKVPEFDKMKKPELIELLKKIYADKISTTVINENKPVVNDLHPTMKPLPLLARQIRNSSKIGELVADLFGGSGSTLMTCEQTNRVCYIMELSPRYCDVIVRRWEQFTGKKAVKL